jgi:hypothetical protein
MKKKIDQTDVTQPTPVTQPAIVNTHPFKVGAQYHNRDGDYQVVSIDAPNMVIRYLNGRTLKSSIALQARIWENMQEGNDHDVDIESL